MFKIFGLYSFFLRAAKEFRKISALPCRDNTPEILRFLQVLNLHLRECYLVQYRTDLAERPFLLQPDHPLSYFGDEDCGDEEGEELAIHRRNAMRPEPSFSY